MSSKFLGGVLLVVGTTIGAGMLALPIVSAQLGFLGSVVILVGCWAVMTACALLFLEVNLWLPRDSNLISMAGATLGRAGQGLAWLVYLFLLYSILSAYVAGGGDLFHYLLKTSGITIPLSLAQIAFVLLFGVVVYFGVRAVDYANRGLMIGKMGAYALLVLFILPHISQKQLLLPGLNAVQHTSFSSISVTIVSFGCLMIVPTLRNYFDGDVKSVRRAIFIGTFIPLICYIAWNLVIMGVIPYEGVPGLKGMMNSPNSSSDLVSGLTTLLQSPTITLLAKFFTSICMATSFLSISLCLSDFLADGFKVKKVGIKGNSFILGATFLPPFLIVSYYPEAFLKGIEYAGLCCMILMIVMPPLMVWSGRYFRKISSPIYQVRGGRLLLLSIFIFGTALMVFGR